MKKVTPTTRSGKNGTKIQCPCGEKGTVYHFSWSRLGCLKCNKMIKKLDWTLPDAD